MDGYLPAPSPPYFQTFRRPYSITKGKDPRTTLPENLNKSQVAVSYHGHFTNFLDFNIEGEKKKSTDIKSRGNFLGQFASKHLNKLFMIKFPHFKGNLMRNNFNTGKAGVFW